jgi:hypothetical protein
MSLMVPPVTSAGDLTTVPSSSFAADGSAPGNTDAEGINTGGAQGVDATGARGAGGAGAG